MGTNCSATESCYYITGRNSSTEFTIQNSGYPGGAGTPGDTNITFSSTAISIYRAFNKLSTANSNSLNSDHLETNNLVTGGYQLNWVCYADGAMDDNLSVSGWTTGADNYIRIYTPTSTNEVGVSQRHNGTWGNGFMLTPSSGNTIAVEEDYVRIEGIAALADPDTGDTYAFLKIPSGTISANNDIRMTECLINGNNAKHRVTMLEDSDTNE